MCALMCEPMRSTTERARESKVTSADMQRIVEQVGRLRKAVAGVKKPVTNKDLQRVENGRRGEDID